METPDSKSNRRLAWLVAASLLLFLVVAVFRVGINFLPYDIPDSAGHRAGYNDPLYWQHYLLMVKYCQPSRFFTREYRYDQVLLEAHLAGLGLLLGGRRVPARLTRWFFALQPFVFFWGIPLLPLALYLAVTMFLPNRSGFDRESWEETPAMLLISGPFWVLVSILIAAKTHGEWLGLRRLAGRVWARLRRVPAKKKPLGAGDAEGLHMSSAAKT